MQRKWFVGDGQEFHLVLLPFLLLGQFLFLFLSGELLLYFCSYLFLFFSGCPGLNLLPEVPFHTSFLVCGFPYFFEEACCFFVGLSFNGEDKSGCIVFWEHVIRLNI